MLMRCRDQIISKTVRSHTCSTGDGSPSEPHSPCVRLLTPICAPSSGTTQAESENKCDEYRAVVSEIATLVRAYTSNDATVTCLQVLALTGKHVVSAHDGHSDGALELVNFKLLVAK